MISFASRGRKWHGRLTLISNTNCFNIWLWKFVSLANLLQTFLDCVPDLLRVMLDPAYFGRDLIELALGDIDNFKVVVDHEHTRRRGSLINWENKTFFGSWESSWRGAGDSSYLW